jgi:hypothetical protein
MAMRIFQRRDVKRPAVALLALSAAAVALAGCYHDAPQASLGGGYGLYFLDEGSVAKLAYGLPNSDDVGLMMECDKGSGRIAVSDIARGPIPARLTLIAGQGRADLPVRAEADAEGGSPILEGAARIDNPALKGFRDSGHIEVRMGGMHYDVDATAAERVGVAQFFSACASRNQI